MRAYWGIGALVAVLVSVAAFFFGLFGLARTVALILLLVGIWTVLIGLFGTDPKDKYYYTGWGVIMAFLSLFDFVPPGYAIGILLLALVGLILVFYLSGRAKQVYTASKGPPPSPGGAPAA